MRRLAWLGFACWLSACGGSTASDLGGAGGAAGDDASTAADASQEDVAVVPDATVDVPILDDAPLPFDTGIGPDAHPTCATACAGCCDVGGVCRAGGDPIACGKGGATCTNCAASGFDCQGNACVGVKPTCDASTCAGCCDAAGDCRFGTDTTSCGAHGASCVDCGAQGLACESGACTTKPVVCGPSNCASGCCDASGACKAGTDDGACGVGGGACAACTANGDKCLQPGSFCGTIQPCGSVTCPTGCCDASGDCVAGRADGACGSGGRACSDCSASSQACSSLGYCYTGAHCGPDNCAGCCTATGQCAGGTANDACGRYGNLCASCTSSSGTCQSGACVTASTCPVGYAGCAPGTATPPPSFSTACTNTDIASIRTACAGDGQSSACRDAAQALLAKHAACFACFQQFLGNDAFSRCLSPFITATCNAELTCALDCQSVACGQCATDAAQQSCYDGSFNSGGVCEAYASGGWCVQAALAGPGAFCNFKQGTTDAGAWMAGVMTYYCH